LPWPPRSRTPFTHRRRPPAAAATTHPPPANPCPTNPSRLAQRRSTALLRDCRRDGPIQSKPPAPRAGLLPPEVVVDGLYVPNTQVGGWGGWGG
jgi:hypothetical protein